MNTLLSSLDNIFAKTLERIAIFCNATLVGLVLFMVVARYIFEWSIIGLDELASISAMWLYMTGAVIAGRRSEHLVVDFLPRKMTSPALKKIYNRLIALVMSGASVFFIYLAWRMVEFAGKYPQTTPGLNIPEIIPQIGIVVASIGSFIYAARDLFGARGCHNQKNGDE